MPEFTRHIESLEEGSCKSKFAWTKNEHARYRAVSFYSATSNAAYSMPVLRVSMPIVPKVL
jgi:hypothetical protein